MPLTKTNKAIDTPKYKVEEYSYHVIWSEEDQAFIGRVSEFPSLAAHGDTREEALNEISIAVEGVLEDLEDSGEHIPEPFSKRQYSGTLNVRMPKHIHRQLAIEAERQGVSLNQLIVSKLAVLST
ncbi:MAG TPA: toxin-antitoxin system HicB family antitoxin [Pyrinomonadaceae bacterium]